MRERERQGRRKEGKVGVRGESVERDGDGGEPRNWTGGQDE